jgi:nucleoside-diphosphate-sugar epimerase
VLIAVTGAAGRLGRWVVDRARRAGHDVVAVDLPAVAARAGDGGPAGVRWRGADVTVLDEVRGALAEADAVIHLAALTGPGDAPEPEVHRINVGATYNVLVAAEELGIGAVCTASSINAIGGVYSRSPRYDYFPVDEAHPSYCEDPYGLSKWIGEQQSAAFARRRPEAVFAALRIHGLRRHATDDLGPRDQLAASGWRDLWGWTSFESAAAACLLALRRPTPGHAAYHVVAPTTLCDEPSEELAARFFPGVELRAPLPGRAGFYRTELALAELGWDAHDVDPAISPAER